MNHQLETNDHQQVTNLSPTAVKQKERSNVKKNKNDPNKNDKTIGARARNGKASE